MLFSYQTRRIHVEILSWILQDTHWPFLIPAFIFVMEWRYGAVVTHREEYGPTSRALSSLLAVTTGGLLLIKAYQWLT